MLSDKQQDNLQQQVNKALDQDINAIDEITKSRLKAARLKALEAKPSFLTQLLQSNRALKYTAASAFSAALVAVVMLNVEPQSTADSPALMAAIDPLFSEEPDMLSDLEFVAWLEQEGLVDNNGEGA